MLWSRGSKISFLRDCLAVTNKRLALMQKDLEAKEQRQERDSPGEKEGAQKTEEEGRGTRR